MMGKAVFDGWCWIIIDSIKKDSNYYGVGFFYWWNTDPGFDIMFDTATPSQKIGRLFKTWAKENYPPGQEGGTSGG